jgi:hypothetical protein
MGDVRDHQGLITLADNRMDACRFRERLCKLTASKKSKTRRTLHDECMWGGARCQSFACGRSMDSGVSAGIVGVALCADYLCV